MTQWRLIGPDLAALIVYLAMDMRVTRRKVKQFLWDVLGLNLSIGTLQNCIVESARALEPVEARLLEELCNDSLMHADESVPRRRAQKVKVLQCSYAAQEMRVGPSESPYRRRLQTTYCCCV